MLLTSLSQVAQAQQTELKQSKSLKGTKDDMSTIAQLEKEFAGGIEQNKKNKAAVSIKTDHEDELTLLTFVDRPSRDAK